MIIDLLLGILLVFVLVGFYLYYKSTLYQYAPQIKSNANLTSWYFPWSPDYNLMQGKDMCGAYAFVAIQRLFGLPISDPHETFKKLSWIILGHGTLPISLEGLLVARNLSVKVPKRGTMSDANKILVLQQELQGGNPIILMVKEKRSHYIVLVGFDKARDVFYVYDPFLNWAPNVAYTRSDDDALSGNTVLSSSQLLHKWHQGGMFGFYNYYAAIVSKI